MLSTGWIAAHPLIGMQFFISLPGHRHYGPVIYSRFNSNHGFCTISGPQTLSVRGLIWLNKQRLFNEKCARTSCDTLQRMNKNRSSTFHSMMFLFHPYRYFFLLTDTFQRLEAILLPYTAKFYRSCLKLDEQCIFTRSFSMHEINVSSRPSWRC